MLRPVIKIDEEKCDGCGKCILDCAEGALEIVNGKAKLIKDSYCDGLGACINCPQGALQLEMREADPFDEKEALAAKAARENKSKILPMAAQIDDANIQQAKTSSWPIQLALIPPKAEFARDKDLLLAAHCAGFTLPSIQKDWLKGRIALIGCPKLQDNNMLAQKLGELLKNIPVSSLSVLRMSVPCCAGLVRIAEKALQIAGKDMPLNKGIVKL